MYYLCLSNIWPETFAAKNPSRNPSIASILSHLRSRGLIVILLNAMLLVVKIHLIIKMSAIATMLNAVDQYDGNGNGSDDNGHNAQMVLPKIVHPFLHKLSNGLFFSQEHLRENKFEATT